MCVVILFFFFKQKTAYEMRISDWSSDVCSSDLPAGGRGAVVNGMPLAAHAESGSSPRISRMPSPGASLIEISDSLNVTPPSTGSKAHSDGPPRPHLVITPALATATCTAAATLMLGYTLQPVMPPTPSRGARAAGRGEG